MAATEIFAFVSFKECGCVCTVCTPHALADTMKLKHFRESMEAGEVRTVATREEWNAIPWNCDAHKPEEKPKKSLFGAAVD